MHTRLAIGGLCLAIFPFSGCGQNSTEKRLDEASKKMEEAGKQMEEAAKQGGAGMGEAMKKMGEAFGTATGKKVTPVDFRELKALLPEALPGMKRTRAEGERAAAMGLNISKAEGEYEKEDSSIHINLMDMGTLSGMAAMATVGWAMVEIDKETETGYEKTSTYQGYKSHEEYNRNNKDGEVTVLVAERFVVEVRGSNLPMEAIMSALGAVDLNKLAAMKGKGVEQ
jgi:hypothetical protein